MPMALVTATIAYYDSRVVKEDPRSGGANPHGRASGPRSGQLRLASLTMMRPVDDDQHNHVWVRVPEPGPSGAIAEIAGRPPSQPNRPSTNHTPPEVADGLPSIGGRHP
jgi:hypothetical protein